MTALKKFRRIHFVGIGGAGMGPIALVLLERGYQISGSDLSENAVTEQLRAGGATVYEGHRAEQIAGAELLAMSTAIPADNPERLAGEAAGLPIWHRARILAEIMRERKAVAVSGTHGKTTTTSMLGLMLAEAGFDPTVLIGGHLTQFGGNARIGRGDWVVAEADESDGSLLQMDPDRIIVTNIEADHLDFYDGIESIERTFCQFVRKLRGNGRVIACLDDPAIVRLATAHAWPILSYSLRSSQAEMYARWIEPAGDAGGARFLPVWRGEPLEPIELHVPGLHNVSNALAALACGLDLGAPLDPMRRALADFHGAKRRFQHKGTVAGVCIIDDYAHHPTEIAATLAAARARLAAQGGGRLVALFQPHRYTRTQHLGADFGRSLLNTDLLVVTGIYAASEPSIPGVSGQIISETAIAEGHSAAHYCDTLDESRALLAEKLEPGDLLLTMGAGNVYRVGEQLVDTLALRAEV